MLVSKFALIMCKIVMNKLLPEHHVTMNIPLSVTRTQTIGLLETYIQQYKYSNAVHILMFWE